MKKLLKAALPLIFVGVVSAKSAIAATAIPVDLTGTTMTTQGSDKIRIKGVSAMGQSYDVALQWNPYDLRFDVATVAAHSSTSVCRTADIASYGATQGYFEVTTDATAKTIQISVTAKSTGAFPYLFTNVNNTGWFRSLIQDGKELFIVSSSSVLNSTSALIHSANGAPFTDTGIPQGVTKTFTLSDIPTWFNFSKPLQGIVWGSDMLTYRCQ